MPIREKPVTVRTVTKLTTPVANSADPSTFAERANTNFLELNTVLDSINTAIGDINTDVATVIATALLASDAPDPVGYGDYLVGATSGETGLTFLAHKSAITDGFRNKVINGQISVNQRGAPGYESAGYTADMWKLFKGAGETMAAYVIKHTDGIIGSPPNHLAFLGLTDPIVNSSWLMNIVEDANTLNGQEVTLTFFANSSSIGTQFDVILVQNFGTGGSTAVSTSVKLVETLTTSWTKYSYTFTLPSTSGKTVSGDSCLEIRFKRASNHANPLAALRVTNLSLVQGDATHEDDPGQWRSLPQELSLCQRYYLHDRKVAASGNASAANQDNACFMFDNFPVTMRDAPDIVFTQSSSTNVGSNPKTSGTGFSVDKTGFVASPRSVASGRTFWRGTYTASAEL